MNAENAFFVPYYIMMDQIWERLGELGKMTIVRYNTTLAPDGTYETKETPEYLEQESLIRRWYELNEYKNVLAGAMCKNNLLVSFRLSAVRDGLAGEKYDYGMGTRIAISVYENQPIDQHQPRVIECW